MPEPIDEISALMLEYALGTADADEVARVDALLAVGDVSAHAALAEAQAVVGMIGLSVDPVSPPAHVRNTVLSHIAADVSANQTSPRSISGSTSQSTSQSTSRSSSRSTSNTSRWFAYGATAVAAGLAIALTLQVQKNQSMSQQLADAAVVDAGFRHVGSSPFVRFAKLTSDTGATPDTNESSSVGRVLFCPVSRQYQLMVFRMTPPPQGRVYEMWLMTADKKTVVPAGTFTVDARGSATHYVKADNKIDWSIAAVTDEPTGGSPTPTGSIHLVGSLATVPESQARVFGH